MIHDVTAAIDVLDPSRATGVTTDDVAAPDAVVRMGTARDEFATRVARREHKRNRRCGQIALERRSLLEAGLTAAGEPHTRDRAGLGLGVGDRVLARIAMCLMRALHAGDIFGRFGGDVCVAIVDSGSALVDAPVIASSLAPAAARVELS